MRRAGPISSSRKSLGSRPAAAASSATKDWTAKAWGMFDTERNQPMRVWAVASGFSMRTLGIMKGMLMAVMPSSNGASFFASGLNVDMIDGATVRCSHATGFPPASSPASRSEEHTSELQSPCNLVCRLLLEKEKKIHKNHATTTIDPLHAHFVQRPTFVHSGKT